MISYLEALELIRTHAQLYHCEQVSLQDACGRISAEDIYSTIDLPSFNNSAMDGFALKAIDTLSATKVNPVKLRVGTTLAAGSDLQNLELADCTAIMTGAAVPDAYNAIIPIEQVQVIHEGEHKYILVSDAVKLSANLRFAGEDVTQGSLIVRASQQLRPQDIMLLAACGVASVMVYSQITIALATSGEEISDEYNQTLNFGQIYNANAPLLQNLATSPVFDLKYHGIIGDKRSELIELINTSQAQIIITTGAVSMGEWDFIPETLREIGAEIIFHKTAIRPGKPILFAKLTDGRYFFGLPGNPVSSFVGWRFFVIPLIRAILGKASEKSATALASTNFNKKHRLRQFLKANLSIDDGVAQLTISRDQESFKIAPLTSSNVWVIATEEQQINVGDKVQFVPLIADLFN